MATKPTQVSSCRLRDTDSDTVIVRQGQPGSLNRADFVIGAAVERTAVLERASCHMATVPAQFLKLYYDYESIFD